MLETASKVQTDNATSHDLTLSDDFILHGPNGTHSVLVTDVGVPILPLLFAKRTPR
jgi:serine/threonine-protein kinase SRPK3